MRVKIISFLHKAEHLFIKMVSSDASLYRHNTPKTDDPRAIRRQLVDDFFDRQPSLLTSLILRTYFLFKKVIKKIVRVILKRGH